MAGGITWLTDAGASGFLLLIQSGERPDLYQSKDLQAAARTLGLQLLIANAITEHDFDAAFATLSQGQVPGLVIGTDGFLVSQSEQLAALTVRYALPTIFQYRAFVMAGGLMSYGGSITD
jgi:putative ABC transport system substrate-binding protein